MLALIYFNRAVSTLHYITLIEQSNCSKTQELPHCFDNDPENKSSAWNLEHNKIMSIITSPLIQGFILVYEDPC